MFFFPPVTLSVPPLILISSWIFPVSQTVGAPDCFPPPNNGSFLSILPSEGEYFVERLVAGWNLKRALLSLLSSRNDPVFFFFGCFLKGIFPFCSLQDPRIDTSLLICPLLCCFLMNVFHPSQWVFFVPPTYQIPFVGRVSFYSPPRARLFSIFGPLPFYPCLSEKQQFR